MRPATIRSGGAYESHDSEAGEGLARLDDELTLLEHAGVVHDGRLVYQELLVSVEKLTCRGVGEDGHEHPLVTIGNGTRHPGPQRLIAHLRVETPASLGNSWPIGALNDHPGRVESDP